MNNHEIALKFSAVTPDTELIKIVDGERFGTQVFMSLLGDAVEKLEKEKSLSHKTLEVYKENQELRKCLKDVELGLRTGLLREFIHQKVINTQHKLKEGEL